MLAPHLHNRPHSHVAASLLVSLGREPIRVQLAGHWITAEAVWAAPDVDQALDSDGPVAVLHLDPDHRAWRALRLQGPGGEFPLAEHPRFRACLNELAASPSAAAALAARATLENSHVNLALARDMPRTRCRARRTCPHQESNLGCRGHDATS